MISEESKLNKFIDVNNTHPYSIYLKSIRKSVLKLDKSKLFNEGHA